MPTVEELQAELSKRDEQIRGLSTKLQAHEKVVKEFGDAVERDSYGNPVRVVTHDRAPARVPNIGHPFAQHFGEADYSNVDAYYQGLIEKQGYLTTAQVEARETAIRQELRGEMMGNIHLFRSLDKTLANKGYADLTDYASARAQRTARILQQNGWGKPLEGADSWDRWQYANADAFRIAADMAEAQLYKEGQAATTSTARATQAAAATELSPAPTSTATGVTGGKPDFSTMKTPEDILAALDHSLTPAGTP
jgi:hypothetical protein